MKTTYVFAVALLAGFVGYGIGGWGSHSWMMGGPMEDHAGHDMGAMSSAMSPWAQAYDDANTAMHAGMMIEYSDNPDLDFARSMIAHHQGAVAMAKIQMEHGKDPEIRTLAEGVIVAQEAEIAQMQAWVAKQ